MLNSNQINTFSEQTVAVAQQSVNKGGLPFSSLIVNQHGECISEGLNQVGELKDCTAHAEIQAIRAASAKLNRTDLSDMTLFASGEPCGLCYMAIRLAKISHVVILLDRHEVKALGFDYLWTYQSEHATPQCVSVIQLNKKRKSAPFLSCKHNLAAIGM